jgi:hypothetical protein
LIGESPVAATIVLPSSVLRYDPATDTQDVVTSAHTLPDGTLAAYRGISGVALLPDGAVYVAEDPSLGLTQSAGKLWQMPSGAPLDALGQPGIPALAPPPTHARRAGRPAAAGLLLGPAGAQRLHLPARRARRACVGGG